MSTTDELLDHVRKLAAMAPGESYWPEITINGRVYPAQYGGEPRFMQDPEAHLLGSQGNGGEA